MKTKEARRRPRINFYYYIKKIFFNHFLNHYFKGLYIIKFYFKIMENVNSKETQEKFSSELLIGQEPTEEPSENKFPNSNALGSTKKVLGYSTRNSILKSPWHCQHHLLYIILGIIIGTTFMHSFNRVSDTPEAIFNNLNYFFGNIWKDISVKIFGDKTITKKTETFVEELMKEFPNQSRNFFHTIISCYDYSVVNELGPSIIILVSNHKESKNNKCVSRRLLKFLSNSKDIKKLIINTKNFKTKQNKDAKLLLDRDLSYIFGEYREKIALVENIENIPAEAMLLFYAYGDEFLQAKFKGILILFTYELKEELSKDSKKQLFNNYAKLSTLVENELNDEWSPYVEYDQLHPLYTRIGNSIILLNEESFCA